MTLTFPAPPGVDSDSCIWTGADFRSGDWRTRVLSYEIGASGWTDDLTRFHEETAGADHYIDIASRERAVEALLAHLRSDSPLIMDVGCSSGLLLSLLRDRIPGARLIGADYVRGPLEGLSGQLSEIPLLQFDLAKCPLQDSFLDAVVALNVLEHIEDDLSAMRHLYRLLKPGGIAVIEVPAGPGLYDLYDQELMHFRRYRMSQLLRNLRSAGFVISEASHLGFFLYPLFALVKLKNKAMGNVPVARRQKVVAKSIQRFRNAASLRMLMRLEARLRRLIYYPFGIRCVVTCLKPEHR